MTYSDHWQCRFLIAGYEESDSDLQLVPKKAITQLLERIESCGLDFIKIENLYEFDGKRAFSATQGE